MDTEKAAKAFKELGHPTRLKIYRYLVKAGQRDVPVGELHEKLEIPNSTLSHHISALVTSGLLTQKREGRTLYCQPQITTLSQLVSYLVEECC